ncbi:MAG: xanthine dehydrogenase accessory protein XdhC [Ideonella sp.]|jgi:xanthine dehydrogenase accessory factor|nr:xanthine dehydrogenase accessory protein XdhC [Ideonella sp.]
MSRVRAAAARWLATGQPAVVVTVIDARGSVPREAGTRMLVGVDVVVGTIGGGHLELEAIAHARRLLGARRTTAPSDDPQRSRTGSGLVGDRGLETVRHFPLGPALGQCCGGTVTLGFAPLDASELAAWPADDRLFSLQLYGAGHVGRALVEALRPLPIDLAWIDEREDEFPTAPDPHDPGGAGIRRVAVDAVEAEVAQARPGDFYLVLTHSHDLDLRITEAILRRGDFGYLGLIGSKTKRARFEHRFEQRGLDPSVVARMTCPIGVPGIAGKQPEVIAAAVVAQLLQAASSRRSA